MNIEQTDKYQIVTTDENHLLKDKTDNSLCTIVYVPLSLTELQIITRFVEIDKNSFVIKQNDNVYTKLQIRKAMRSLGIQNKLTGLLNSNSAYRNDWNDAKEIDLYSDEVQNALTSSSITKQNIDDIIDEIKSQGDKYLGQKLIDSNNSDDQLIEIRYHIQTLNNNI